MRIDEHLLDNMSKDARCWFARAIARIINADEFTDEEELHSLREVISFVKDEQEINKIIHRVKENEQFPLEVLKLDRDQAFEILLHLTRLTIVDEVITLSETQILQDAAVHLGFPTDFSKNLVTVALKELETKKIVEHLRGQAKRVKPSYPEVAA